MHTTEKRGLENMDGETAIAIGTFLLVLVTGLLVYVTVYFNRKIIGEALSMRQAEFKPIIYIDDWTSYDNIGPGNQWFQFFLKNIGRGPAFNIEIRVDGVKPETIANGMPTANSGYSLPVCLAAGEKSESIRIIYGEEEIAGQKYDTPNLVVRYRDMIGHLIESRKKLCQKEIRLTAADPPFYLVKSTQEFTVQDL